MELNIKIKFSKNRAASSPERVNMAREREQSRERNPPAPLLDEQDAMTQRKKKVRSEGEGFLRDPRLSPTR